METFLAQQLAVSIADLEVPHRRYEGRNKVIVANSEQEKVVSGIWPEGIIGVEIQEPFASVPALRVLISANRENILNESAELKSFPGERIAKRKTAHRHVDIRFHCGAISFGAFPMYGSRPRDRALHSKVVHHAGGDRLIVSEIAKEPPQPARQPVRAVRVLMVEVWLDGRKVVTPQLLNNMAESIHFGVGQRVLTDTFLGNHAISRALSVDCGSPWR